MRIINNRGGFLKMLLGTVGFAFVVRAQAVKVIKLENIRYLALQERSPARFIAFERSV